MMIKSIPFAVFLLFTGHLCFAQWPDDNLWNTIERSIQNKTNLNISFERLDEIKSDAEKEKNYNQFARACYYQLIITDYRTEDTFYFKNAAFIDSILQSAAPPDLKVYMHLFQAERLSSFNRRYKKFSKSLYKPVPGGVDYAGWSNQSLDSLVSTHYRKAKSIAAGLSPLKANYLWLAADPLQFLFEPQLKDIILAEEIDFYTAFGSPNQVQFLIPLLSLSTEEFIRAISESISTKDESLYSLRLYGEWINDHRQDTAVAYFLETLARKYVYEHIKYWFQSEEQYTVYLERNIESPFEMVRAHALFQLISIYEKNGQEYIPAYYESDNARFNPLVQFHPSKALALYESNHSLFKKYPVFDNILRQLKPRILSRKLNWEMDQIHLPGENILCRLTYKNIREVKYRIVKVTDNETMIAPDSIKLRYLQQKISSREGSIPLELPDDHNFHRSFAKLDPLPIGNYYLIFQEKNDTVSVSTTAFLHFQISEIVTQSSDNRVYVMHRRTGFPIPGAHIKATYHKIKDKVKIPVTRHFTTNQHGFIDLPKNEEYDLVVSYHQDTLYDGSSPSEVSLGDEIFDKEEDDTFEDFYSNNTTVHFYTDRAIYRPGQTVYYKAIFMSKHPFTGKPIIVTRANLIRRSFKKMMDMDEPWIFLEDPFGRDIDSLEVKLDDYGSISGSFIIPKNAATGSWNIYADMYDAEESNSGEFEVEEYKRPTFEINIDDPVRSWYPGDTLQITLRVKSFAGASLSNTLIKYSVERRIVTNNKSNREDWLEVARLADTIGYSDAAGMLKISIPDPSLLPLKTQPDGELWSFRYTILAEAIDGTGENQTTEKSIIATTRPINIRIPVTEKMEINDIKPILITAKDANNKDTFPSLNVELYRIEEKGIASIKNFSHFADQWSVSIDTLKTWFPSIQFEEIQHQPKETLILQSTINTSVFEKIRLTDKNLQPGKYKIKATAKNLGRITGEKTVDFTLFQTGRDLLHAEASFFHLPYNYINAGDTIRLFRGSAYDSVYAIIQVKYFSTKGKKLHTEVLYQEEVMKKGISAWKWKIPSDATEIVKLSSLFIKNNEAYLVKKDIPVSRNNEQPRIEIEQMRHKLSPGETTRFSVSLKIKDRNLAGQLMTSIYDASLDKLSKHQWSNSNYSRLPRLQNDWFGNIEFSVSREIAYPIITSGALVSIHAKYIEQQAFQNPLLWLQGRVPGVSILSSSGLNDVVTIGYGTRKNMSVTTAVPYLNLSATRLRGITSLTGNTNPLIILDGVPFANDLSTLDPAEITNVLVLKDAEATGLYGSRGVNGVVILSTKGEIKLPLIQEDPVPKIRNNFNETAFFAPAIYADNNGLFHFTFTMPESVTEWNWKMLAHTKNAEFAYAEKKLTTQLPLMIQPNMPRFLYAGDRIVLKSRISNLDTLNLEGRSVCTIEDAVTGEDLTDKLIAKKEISFAVDKKSNVNVAVEIRVPAEFLNPLRIKVTARTSSFADAEEHIIPVLSKQILVKHHQSIQLLKQDTLIATPALPRDAKVLGIGLSIQPKPQASLINSLPYLANYSYNCAEQTFNKLYAHYTALQIMRIDSIAQKSFDDAMSKPAKENPAPIPFELAEQTMPWLSLNNQSYKHQQQLLQLLDTMKTKEKIQIHLQRLIDLQNPDGSLSWFDGGPGNPYISSYVLAGFGRMKFQGWSPETLNMKSKSDYEKLINNLIRYFDKNTDLTTTDLLFARSYWLADFPLNDSLQQKIISDLQNIWGDKEPISLTQQAKRITTTLRFLPPSHQLCEKALSELQSIRQLAIQDPVNGIRWKELADTEDLTISAEETIAFVQEAFRDAGMDKEINAGLIQWLLQRKNEPHWKTTKGTAAAIDMLRNEKNIIIGSPQSLVATIGNTQLVVSDDLLSGNIFAFHQAKFLAPVKLGAESGTPVSGTISWHYLSASPDLNPESKEISISKTLFRLNSRNDSWEKIDSNSVLSIGDKIKIELHFQSPKALRYVYIDDKGSAGMESIEKTSGYQYRGGFSYYRSIRDAGQEVFAEIIPAGKTSISYEMTVSMQGNFAVGPVMLQCMYKPELTSYGKGGVIRVE